MSVWKEYQLGDIVTFQRGHDLPKYDMKHGIYPVAGSNGIIGFHNVFTTKAPGITIGRSGSIGNPVLHKTNFWAHNTTLYVKEFKRVDPIFFYYLLKTLDFTQLNSGSAVPSLNRNFIHPYLITIPDDIPTQTAIASILSSLDDKIELNNKINKNLEDLAQVLFKQWFIDFEFPISLNCDSYDSGDGHDLLKLNKSNQGNHINQKNHITDTYRSSGGEMVESELGEIPKGWSAERLGDHLYVKGRIGWKGLKTADYLTDGSGYVIINGSDFKNERINFKNCSRISKERYDESPEIQLKDHDILITKDGTIGKLAFVDKLDEPTSVASGIFVVRIISKLLSTYFCWSFFKSYYFQKLVKGRIEGTVVPHLYQRDFVEMYIPIPPKELRSIYEEQSRLIFENISSNLRENLMLEDLRDMILPKLISGELEVNEDNV